MASLKASEQVGQWLSARGVTRVTDPFFAELARAFPARKEQALRQALRKCGVPLDPLVEGVRQESLEELARTLVALQHEYQSTNNKQRIRSMVIESKAHARFASRKRPEKQEMVEWMLVWLHDPSLFETWVKLRLRLLGERAPSEMAQPDASQANEH